MKKRFICKLFQNSNMAIFVQKHVSLLPDKIVTTKRQKQKHLSGRSLKYVGVPLNIWDRRLPDWQFSAPINSWSFPTILITLLHESFSSFSLQISLNLSKLFDHLTCLILFKCDPIFYHFLPSSCAREELRSSSRSEVMQSRL